MSDKLWQMLEETAPAGCEGMIGYSDEHYGMPLYGPTVHAAENNRGVTSWDAKLGYVELGKLAAALIEYADNPVTVTEYVESLMNAETGEDDADDN